MCQVVSLLVIPKTLEVIHIPGEWHHSAICEKRGIPYEEVFKPEFHLNTRRIEFPQAEQQLAFKRKLPADLMGDIATFLHQRGYSDEESGALSLFSELRYTWEKKHEVAVLKWCTENIDNWKKLIDFSESTWEPTHYRGTCGRNCEFSLFMASKAAIADSTARLLQRQWRHDFSNGLIRSSVWNYSTARTDYARLLVDSPGPIAHVGA